MSSSDQTELTVASAFSFLFQLQLSRGFAAFSSKGSYWNWLAETIHCRAFQRLFGFLLFFFFFLRRPKSKLLSFQLSCKVLFNHWGASCDFSHQRLLKKKALRCLYGTVTPWDFGRCFVGMFVKPNNIWHSLCGTKLHHKLIADINAQWTEGRGNPDFPFDKTC